MTNASAKSAKPSLLYSWFNLLRVPHWIKNLLVFLPLAFAGELFNLTSFINSILAFVSFSFASSFAYILNDINDIGSDKLHPTKRLRPLASGAVNRKVATIISIALLVLSLALSFIPASPWATIILLCYTFLNIGYSFGLKNIPVVDIAILASGFVLRVIFGGVYCGIPISLWLFLTILSFATYFACGKRNGELKFHGTNSRKTLEFYTPAFLSQGMSASLALSLVFYSLWSYENVLQFTNAVSISSLLVVFGVPLVMLICLRYSYLITCTDSDGDPVTVLLKDKQLTVMLLCWIATICYSIYFIG